MGKINASKIEPLSGASVPDGSIRKAFRGEDQIISGKKTLSEVPVIQGPPVTDDDIVTKAYVDSVFSSLAATHSYTLELEAEQVTAKRVVLPLTIMGDKTVTRLKLQGTSMFIQGDASTDGFRVIGSNTIDWNGNTSGYFDGAEAGKKITVYYVGTAPTQKTLKVQEYFTVTFENTQKQLGQAYVIDSSRLIAPPNWYLNDLGIWQETNTFGFVACSYGNTAYAVNGSKLNKSTNAGATWSEVGSISTNYYGFSCLSADTLICASLSGEVKKSVNGGVSWENVFVPDSYYVRPGYYYRHTARLENGVLLASFGKGIFRSNDSGASWELTSFPTALDVWGIQSLGKGRVIAHGTEFVYLSTDYGLTWATLANKGAQFPYGSKFIAPIGDNGIISLFSREDYPDDAPYHTWRYWDVYMSEDNGTSWRKAGTTVLPWYGYTPVPMGKSAVMNFQPIDTYSGMTLVHRKCYVYRFSLV